MTKLITPFRVGLLVLASAGLFFTVVFFLNRGGAGGKPLHLHAYFKDATGLGKRSRVQIAGIPVGEVEGVTLEGNRARLDLKIGQDAGLHKDARIVKRSESFLGDFLLDLQPGSETAPLMQDGDEIVHVLDSGGLENLFETLGAITKDIQAVTTSLRQTLAGGDGGQSSLEAIVRNITDLSRSVNDTARRSSDSIATILENIKTVSQDVRGITEGQGQNVQEIVENVKSITGDVRRMVSDVAGTAGADAGTSETAQSIANLKGTLQRLDDTLNNLQQVTQNVREGKGVAGKILSDDRLGQKLSETIEDVSDYANRLTGLKAEVNISANYLFNQQATRTEVDILLIPRPDKYYLIGLVDDPRGNTTTEYVQLNPPGQLDPSAQVRRTTTNSLKINAEFAKRFYFLTLRFGLLESTGGLGADLHLFKDSLTFTVEAFNFADQRLRFPRVRAGVRYVFLQHLYATAGVDDVFNKPINESLLTRPVAGRDFFVGAGIFFTDDDLKAILSVAPKP